MTVGRAMDRWAAGAPSAREMPRAATVKGAARALGCAPSACTTRDSAAVTWSLAARIGTPTDSASMVTWRSLTA